MSAVTISAIMWTQLLAPAAGGIGALIMGSSRIARGMLVASAAAHLLLTMALWSGTGHVVALDGWLGIDELGRLFLGIVSLLFAVAAAYLLGYLSHCRIVNAEETPARERVFIALLLLFLSTMTLVTFSQHFELLWVAIEATTLASAPLVNFNRGPHAVEATWKYLIICSFGIALALLGNFCLSIASSGVMTATHSHEPLLVSRLAANGAALEPTWLRASFIFLLVGYGTKMGLAPLHTWLPDAHSEAPSAISSLLSGALLGCAFLGILRGYEVCVGAGLAPFARDLLTFFGLFSMGVAALFILHQSDYKRMLAYSSVEHMGILALSVGLGGGAIFAGMWHAIGHSLIKAMLFLVAGNILIAYHSKSTRAVRGALAMLPSSAALWLIGLFAITGFPPFGLFTSELLILKTALAQHRYWVSFLFLAFLSVIFLGMAAISLPMLLGEAPDTAKKRITREWRWSILPPVVLAIFIFSLGPYIPPFLGARLQNITRQLEGHHGH